MPSSKKLLPTYINWMRKHPVSIVAYLLTLVILLTFLMWAFNPNQAPNWTGFGKYQNSNGYLEREKTLWDWMNLLIVPMALGIGAYLLNRSERATEKQIANERILENTLQDYLDKMTELLLKENLRESEYNDEARSIARSRTLTALRILDNSRKGILLKFLHELGLISRNPIIKLKGADLSGVNLRKANLSGANIKASTIKGGNMEQTRLIEANLRYCEIEKSIFSRASLLGADLSLVQGDGTNFIRSTLENVNFDSASLKKSLFTSAHGVKANFQSAQLQQSNFESSNLQFANFNRANLENASFENTNLTGATFRGANLQNTNFKGAILDDVDFSFANLKRAKLKSTQLEKVKSLSVAIMMNGKLN